LEKVEDKHHVPRVAIAILNYLRDHPSAKDSAKGIAQWWVGEKLEMVEKALALLTREGVIEVRGKTFQLAQRESAPENDTA